LIVRFKLLLLYNLIDSVPDNWLILLVFIIQYFRVLKMLNQTIQTLQTSIGEIANLNQSKKILFSFWTFPIFYYENYHKSSV